MPGPNGERTPDDDAKQSAAQAQQRLDNADQLTWGPGSTRSSGVELEAAKIETLLAIESRLASLEDVLVALVNR